LRFLGIAKRMALILILEYEVPEMWNGLKSSE
jgi:hypothetical protein